jgi:hypothetical protein
MNNPRLQAAIDQFWTDVKNLLKKKHRHTDQDAQQGIDDYRRVADPKLGEVVYNQGEAHTAEVIHGLIDGSAAKRPLKSQRRP